MSDDSRGSRSARRTGRSRSEAKIIRCTGTRVGLENPVWLCRLRVFVDQSAEDRSSPDPRHVEVDDPRRWFGRLLLEGSVRPMLVVVPDILDQHTGQVPLVDDEDPVGAHGGRCRPTARRRSSRGAPAAGCVNVDPPQR